MNDKVTLGQPRPKRRRAAALQGVFVVMRMRRRTTIGDHDAPTIKELAAGHDSNQHSRVTLLGDADGRDALGFVLSRRSFSSGSRTDRVRPSIQRCRQILPQGGFMGRKHNASQPPI